MSDFKYTIPVTRAWEDGALYLEGEATGPEQDNHRTRMLPEAIEDFARQIKERWESGDPIPYLDAHQKIVTREGQRVKVTPKGALARLGHVVEGWIKPNGRLGVRVELDKDNPAALFIHRKAAQGFKYGMSIYGNCDPKTDVVKDDQGIAFKRISLGEISNTTAPSWVHSLGTVLARSLDADEADEENPMTELANEAERTEAPAEETTEDAERQENESPEAPAAEAAETTEETTERETQTEAQTEAEVERARISKADNEKVVEAFTAFYSTLTGLGVELPKWEVATDTATEPAATEAAPESASREEVSETGTEANVVEFAGHAVEREVAEAIAAFVGEKMTEAAAVIERQAEYIKKLEEMPAGKTPPARVKGKFENPLDEITSIQDPNERLKAALNIIYQNH